LGGQLKSMSSTVYFLPVDSQASHEDRGRLLYEALKETGFCDTIEEKDIVAVKTHFGEGAKSGFPRPAVVKAIGDLIKEKGGRPFLTETSTLYRGNRTDALSHLLHAHNQGFTIENTGMPIIMSDGLLGDNEVEVEIPGKIYSSIKVASEIVKAQKLFVLSHFTGHIVAGFGATLKNLGMGCTSRRAKMIQHSTAKPKIKKRKCTTCGVCARWCPVDAITINEETAVIDKEICIGCGQCLALCRYDAVKFNWSATYEDIQKKVVEHALGVVTSINNKGLYVNMLMDISKECDCIDGYEKISPDMGFLFSTDPVALDDASLEMVEHESGKKLSEMAFDIPYTYQVDYAREIGFYSGTYTLKQVDIRLS
jgi:uncharacterized protein